MSHHNFRSYITEKSNMATISVKNQFFVYMSLRTNFIEKCYGRKKKRKKILYMFKKIKSNLSSLVKEI